MSSNKHSYGQILKSSSIIGGARGIDTQMSSLAEASQKQPLTVPSIGDAAVPREWNGFEMPFPRECSVLDFFRVQVQARPASTAVEDGCRRMTYRELDLCSNRVANQLLAHGLGLEGAVVVFLPASCEFLAAILGVLKAGGTYFPVATDMPGKRLEYLLRDSGSRLVLADAAGREHFQNWPGAVLEAAQLMASGTAAADRDPGIACNPNRRAYVTYTSGSTGQPKGVEIEHHALTNFVGCFQRRFDITTQDRIAVLAYIAFDASVGEIWPALCAGGVLVIPPAGLLFKPDGLIEWLAAEEITLAFVSTGLVEIILTRPWPERMKLRFLTTGGDRLRVRPAAGLPFALINVYGPTENTVWCTWTDVLPEDGAKQPPPIGRPLANTTAYVLDEQMRPVPVGVVGELYVGGEQVGRGYLGRPELTAERFLPDPFSGKHGARMYRTGDWARWLPDGQIDFIGRKDGQIKIRGWRVELGEIEAALFAHGGIRQVCCVPWLDDGMPAAVIAHIVPQHHAGDISGELHSYLQPLLPDHMVPSKFLMHESLPLTPQGKVDRAALIVQQSAKPAQPPQIATSGNELEKKLARLWHTMLPAAASSPPDATFRALGGDSLLAIKLMLEVENIAGIQFDVSSFLLQPTLEGLMRLVQNRLAGESPRFVAMRPTGSRPPLFFLHGLGGDVNEFLDLAGALGEDQPVYGILSPALFDAGATPESLEAAAAAVLPWLRRLQPTGPLCLAGHSWGGLLAFETARQVMAAEGKPPFVALLDSVPPQRSVGFARRIRHCMRWLPVATWYALKEQQKRRGRIRRLANMTRHLSQPGRGNADDAPPLPDWLNTPLAREHYGLMSRYQPKTMAGMAVDFFRAQRAHPPCPHPFDPEDTRWEEDAGWHHWTGQKTRLHFTTGDHVDMLKPPNVSMLAAELRIAMDQWLQINVLTLETGNLKFETAAKNTKILLTTDEHGPVK